MWSQKYSLYLALILIAFGTGCGRGADREVLDERSRFARQLAEALPAEYAEGPIVVLANPFINKSGVPPDVRAYHRACLQGLADGLGRSIGLESIVFPALKDGAWEQPERFLIGRHTSTPLSYLMVPEALDVVRAQNPEARLIISLVGLPAGFDPMKDWHHQEAPALALYLPDFSLLVDQRQWVRAFEAGRILLAVQMRSGYDDGIVIDADNARSYFLNTRR